MKEAIRALVVDDERLARQELRRLLAAHPEVRVVGEAAGVDEAARLIERQQPDVVFLDVQLPGETGFDLFERAAVSARVVFVTAHDAHALRAFDVNALDYLLKPVAPERLAETVAREAGARTAVLNPIEGLNEEQANAGADYFSLMRENLRALREALGCR